MSNYTPKKITLRYTIINITTIIAKSRISSRTSVLAYEQRHHHHLQHQESRVYRKMVAKVATMAMTPDLSNHLLANDHPH